ncbi:MAG: Ppx/GppA family phosphatase [Nitrospiraceae bacterium]|nr:Ppx/GppA family phosphatase [Nitrospiraceae bacterium]
MLLAGIDIGTLTCRLLIGRVAGDGRLTEVHSDRRILRLGEGVDRDRLLRPAAVARVVETLRDWRSVINSYHVDAQVAVATSAVRNARNREEFLGRVKQEVGFDVEVISGEEEARRTLLGIRSGLPGGVSSMLGLDIGGGSTEFILDRPSHAPIVHSVEIGVVRLTERLFTSDPPTTDEIQAARELITKEAEQARVMLGEFGGVTLVGTAGSITTLAAMAQKLSTYEPLRIHNYRLSLETIRGLERELLGRTTAQRREMPGLEAGREDVVVAGTLILRGVMETLGFSEGLVSDVGLREGILLDLAVKLLGRNA